MNKVILIGRLTADPDVNQTQSGSTVAKYTLAVDRSVKKEDQQQADFIRCTCFGKTAEFASKYLVKGMKIAVEGRIQTGSYVKDDVKHFTTDVIVDRHEFCESRKTSSSAASDPLDKLSEFDVVSEIDEDDDGDFPF